MPCFPNRGVPYKYANPCLHTSVDTIFRLKGV
jgi:hypothetical protein